MKHGPRSLSRYLDIIEKRRQYNKHMIAINSPKPTIDTDEIPMASGVAAAAQHRRHNILSQQKFENRQLDKIKRHFLDSEFIYMPTTPRRKQTDMYYDHNYYNNYEETKNKMNLISAPNLLFDNVVKKDSSLKQKPPQMRPSLQVLERLGLEKGMSVIETNQTYNNTFNMNEDMNINKNNNNKINDYNFRVNNNHLTNSNSKEINNNNLDVQMKQSLLISPKNKGNIVMKPNPRRSPKSKPIMMTTETQTDKKQSKKKNKENDVKFKPKLPEGREDLKSPRNNIRTISRRTVEYSSSESDDEDGYKIPKIEVDHSRRSNYPDSNKGNNENNNQSSSKNNKEGKKSRSDSKSEGDEYDYDTENEFENKNGENCDDDNTIVDKSNTNCYSIYQSQKDEPSDISHRSYSSYNSLNNDDFIDDNNDDNDSDYNDNNFNYSDQNDYNDNNYDSDNENESSKVENFDSFELISPIKLNAKVNQNMSSSTSNMQSGNYISDKLVSKEENEESNQNQEENSQSSIIEKNFDEESSNTLTKHESEAQMVLSETKPKSDNEEENKNDQESKPKKNSSDQEIYKESEKQQDQNNESSRVHSSIHSEPEKDNNDKDHEKESDKGNNQKDEFEFEEELPEVEKKKDEFEFEEEVDEYNEFEDDIADEKIRTAKLKASSKRTNRSELSESSNSLFNEFSDQGLMQNTDDAFEDISSSETDSGFDTLTKPQKKNEEVDPFEQISSDSSKDDEQDKDDRKTHNEKNVSENMEKEDNIDQEKNIEPDDGDKDMKADLENCEKNRSESPKSWEIELESSKMENSELDNNFLVDSDQEREESEKRKIESDQNRILSDERKEESDRNQIDSIFNRENVLENTLKKNSNSLIGSPNHRDSKMSQSSNGSKIFAYLEKQVQSSSSSSSINQSNDTFNILSDHANNNENNVNENENETNKNFTNITGTYFGHEENETFNTPSLETTNHSILSKSKSNSSSGNKNEDHNSEKHSNGLDGVKDDENLSVVQFVNSEQKNFEQDEIELVLSDTSDVEQVKNVSSQSKKISSDSIEGDYSEVSSEKPMLNELLDRAESLLNPNPTYELEEEFSNKENQIETKCDAKIDNKENFDFNEDSIIIDDSSEEEFLMTTGNSIEDKEKLLNENILNQKVEDISKKVHQVQKEKDEIDEMINEKSSELAINDSFEQSLNIDETFSEENDQKSFNIEKEQDKPNLENTISNKVDSLFKVNENNEKETNQFEFDEKSESVIIDDSEINSFEDSVQLDLALPNNDDNNPILEDKKVTDSKKVKIVDQSSDDLFEIKLDHESDDNKGENDQDNDNKNIAQIIESDGEKQINDIFNLLSSQNILLNKESENSQKDKISSAIKPKPKTPVRTGKIELDGDNSENDDSFDLSRVSSSPFTNGTFTISEDEAHKTSNLTLNDISKKVLPNPPKQEEQSCPNDKFTLKFKMPTVAQLKDGRIVFDNFSESAESDDLSFTENLDHSLNGKSETKENAQNKKEQTKTGPEATSFIDEDDDSFLE